MSLFSGELRDYMSRLDLTEARVKHKITDTYRKIIKEILVDIVTHTPQFTGNLARGWQVVFGPYSAQDVAFVSDDERRQLYREYRKGDFDPFEMGDDPAVEVVLQRELKKLKDIRYNSLVKIVNTVEYADDVDDGKGPGNRNIRPENLHYGKVFMVTRAEIKYGKLSNLIKIAS